MSIRTERRWQTDFAIITAISFLTYTTNQTLNNSTALYVLSLGSDTSYGGALMSIFTIAALVSRLVCGKMIDNWGARAISLASAALFAASILCYLLLADLRLLFLWRVLQGISYAALGTASGAAVAKILPRQAMSRGIFVFGLGQSIALCVGPFIALSLMNGSDFNRVYCSAAAIIFCAVPLGLLCRYPVRSEPDIPQAASDAAGRRPLFRPSDLFEIKTVKPAVVQVLSSMAVSLVVFYMSLFASDKAYANAKLFFLIASVTMILVRVFLSELLARLRNTQVLTLGCLSGMTSFLILITTRDARLYMASAVFYGVLHATIGPVLQTLSVQSVPIERRGVATSSYYLAVDVGTGIGTALWGVLIDHFGFSAAALTAIVCLAAAILLTFVFFRSSRNRRESTDKEQTA